MAQTESAAEQAETDVACRTCAFYVRSDLWRKCRRYPPVTPHGSQPNPPPDFWCGEWRPRPAD